MWTDWPQGSRVHIEDQRSGAGEPRGTTGGDQRTVISAEPANKHSAFQEGEDDEEGEEAEVS